MHDLLIRNATVVDGSGVEVRTANVAIDAGRIVKVGTTDAGSARRTIDADGLLLTPGWVDVHTHYDGQATGDNELTPSSWHGVTTSIFGNCGVRFAPAKPGAEGYLINLMEGVEDIPGSVLTEGIDFNWESFPEYLDVLEQHGRTMDIGAQMPHGALRFYVMVDRGADHTQAPTADEILEMGRLLEQALHAGAMGFTTSLTIKHKAADRSPTPTLSAPEAELFGLADAMRRPGRGVLECNSDLAEGDLDVLVSAAQRNAPVDRCQCCCYKSTTHRSFGVRPWLEFTKPTPMVSTLPVRSGAALSTSCWGWRLPYIHSPNIRYGDSWRTSNQQCAT